MTEMNPWSLCHLFLLRHCDGDHAARFVACFTGTHFDMLAPEFEQRISQVSYEEQVRVIVDFWGLQFANCGFPTTPQARLVAIQLAVESFENWFIGLVPFIESHNLPIIPARQ